MIVGPAMLMILLPDTTKEDGEAAVKAAVDDEETQR